MASGLRPRVFWAGWAGRVCAVGARMIILAYVAFNQSVPLPLDAFVATAVLHELTIEAATLWSYAIIGTWLLRRRR